MRAQEAGDSDGHAERHEIVTWRCYFRSRGSALVAVRQRQEAGNRPRDVDVSGARQIVN